MDKIFFFIFLLLLNKIKSAASNETTPAECTISLAATQHKCVYSTKYYVMRNKYNSTKRIILRQINTTIQLRRKYILPNLYAFCQ